MPAWIGFCIGALVGICAGYWLSDDVAKENEARCTRRRRSGGHLNK